MISKVPTAIDIFAHTISRETYLADREVLQVAGKELEFMKLRGKTRTPVNPKETGNILNGKKHKLKIINQLEDFFHTRCDDSEF